MVTFVCSTLEADRLVILLRMAQAQCLDHALDITQRSHGLDTHAAQLCRQWASWAADLSERLVADAS